MTSIANKFAIGSTLATLERFFSEDLPALSCFAEFMLGETDGKDYVDTLSLAGLNLYQAIAKAAYESKALDASTYSLLLDKVADLRAQKDVY